MNDQIPPPTGPEAFTKNYVALFKGYFCKYVCQKEWDNFYEEDILMNEELRNNARAVIESKSLKVIELNQDTNFYDSGVVYKNTELSKVKMKFGKKFRNKR
jgi:hypothetical protein